MTYHNEGPIFRETLETLRASGAPDELLIFDDASTLRPDGFLVEGLPARIIRSDSNVGPGRGRNELIRHASGDFVHFHDADDLFEASWTPCVAAAINQGFDAVFTEIDTIAEDGSRSARVMGWERLAAHGDLVRFALAGSILTSSCTVRRSLAVSLGGFRDALWQSEDWDFGVRLAARRPRFLAIPSSLVTVRIRARSRSQARHEVWTSALDAVESLGRELPATYADELAAAATRFASALAQGGAWSDSARGFAVANSLGGLQWRGRRAGFRVLAKLAGPICAERIASLTRTARRKLLKPRA